MSNVQTACPGADSAQPKLKLHTEFWKNCAYGPKSFVLPQMISRSRLALAHIRSTLCVDCRRRDLQGPQASLWQALLKQGVPPSPPFDACSTGRDFITSCSPPPLGTRTQNLGAGRTLIRVRWTIDRSTVAMAPSSTTNFQDPNLPVMDFLQSPPRELRQRCYRCAP